MSQGKAAGDSQEFSSFGKGMVMHETKIPL